MRHFEKSEFKQTLELIQTEEEQLLSEALVTVCIDENEANSEEANATRNDIFILKA
jgi:hypothetical protein